MLGEYVSSTSIGALKGAEGRTNAIFNTAFVC
jgi:hypothetical protein